MTINNDFPQIINYAQHKPISRIYVFGSTARNQTDSNSDIDLLVELEFIWIYSLSIRLKNSIAKKGWFNFK